MEISLFGVMFKWRRPYQTGWRHSVRRGRSTPRFVDLSRLNERSDIVPDKLSFILDPSFLSDCWLKSGAFTTWKNLGNSRNGRETTQVEVRSVVNGFVILWMLTYPKIKYNSGEPLLFYTCPPENENTSICSTNLKVLVVHPFKCWIERWSSIRLQYQLSTLSTFSPGGMITRWADFSWWFLPKKRGGVIVGLRWDLTRLKVKEPA